MSDGMFIGVLLASIGLFSLLAAAGHALGLYLFAKFIDWRDSR